MNLRDKLRSINSQPARPEAAPKPSGHVCWQKTVTRGLEEFPGAFDLRRQTVMLMQGDEMPPRLDPTRILYLDTETTGLSGGAGTVAFEVGLGWLTRDGFMIRQLVMRDYPQEKSLLEKLRDTAERFDVICTFNGKTFDLPLLRSRFLMNRIKTDCLEKPHLDLIHIARRVWKLRLKKCSLSHLQEAILGIPRFDDLPGSQVPQRYFDYLKTGDFSLLTDVLEHNEQDIASLCVLLNAMCERFENPERQQHAQDLYSMGAALDRLEHHEEARRCYRLLPYGRLHAKGQLNMAGTYRRLGEKKAAADVWHGMILRRQGGAKPYIELAKYYEHTVRDIPLALQMTEKAMMQLAEPTFFEDDTIQEEQLALQYRYARLKRKLAQKKEML